MADEDNTLCYIELREGTVLCDGKYTIKKKIGEGGFGITYLAIQHGLNRTVCIKEYFLAGKCLREPHSKTIMAQGSGSSVFEKYRQAFVREAKMLASLKHANIVEVIDVFDENNTSYMAMPFIEGRSLQKIVEERGPLPYPEVVNYMAQIANAVGYIHERHILHRDIKPDNIMITADYKAILIDFGSAREFEHDKTQVHTSMVTHGYAPTEQYTANSRKGAYTDIYAIGATMYFLLTGVVPLEAASRLTEPLPEPKSIVPSLPVEANRTIMKAMQLKSENRHQSIAEFMDDLRNVKPSVIVDETIGQPQPRPDNRNVKPLILGVIFAGILIVGLVAYLLSGAKKDPESQKPAYAIHDFTGEGLYPMVRVEGGTFTMGSDKAEDDDCEPHEVTVDDYYIGQFEVSQGLWKMIMGDNPSYSEGVQSDSLPVENVSYDDVQLFIRRLNEKTGVEFELPTEAQWEYAARGGQKSHNTDFSGSEHPGNLWFDKQGPYKILYSPSVNELGIYHMSGNVAEWCVDTYDDEFYEKSKNMKNPVNIVGSDDHVVRGGSYEDDEYKYITVFYRDSSDRAKSNIGFRLVMNRK